ncbi:MAG: exosortase/archaeosortase family protein [Verrucomicrobiales bacterium]
MIQPSPLERFRGSWMRYLPLVACAAVLVYLCMFFPYAAGYRGTRVSLLVSVRKLWAFPDWQHGMLVPFIVVGLLVYKWKEIFTDPARGSAWGLPVLALGFFTYWVGFKANVYYFGFGAVQILLAGLILWFLGLAYFKRLFFFWCFFAFSWPLFFLTDTLAFKLRFVMIQLSSGFLRLVGVENMRSGTSIQSLGDPSAGLAQGDLFALDIADPCSGIRSLFALLMVSALWGYLTLDKPWQRWALFFSAAPLAVLGNFIRVLLLVFGSLVLGEDIAVGQDGGASGFHFMAGIAVFVTALGGMVAIGRFLKSGTNAFRSREVVRRVGGARTVVEDNG